MLKCADSTKLIVFRVDSATQIGTGHVMRCLTLATALREEGATCLFICRNHHNNIIPIVRQKGFTVYELPTGKEPTTAADLGVSPEQDAEQTKQVIKSLEATPDWLIVDHYGIDKAWEQHLRPVVKQIFVIDDLANRPHDCDVLLDQNYTHRWDRYEGLVPKHCCQLLGPEYALLRPEFIAAREKLEKEGRPPFDPRKVLVFFGGMDPQNYTSQALKILREIGDFAPEVVIGAANPHRAEIEAQMRYFPEGQLHIQTDKMAEIMLRCSWYFGAGGSITWERMCLGLTGIVIPIAENQVEFSRALEDDGFHILSNELSYISKIDFNSLFEKIQKFSYLSNLLVDSKGIDKIRTKINHYIDYKFISMRSVTVRDSIRLFLWANDRNVRHNSWNQEFIILKDHLSWFNQRINSNNSKIYIMEYKKIPIAQIRYEKKYENNWILDYSISSGFRGYGIGVILLRMGENHLKKDINENITLYAEVRDNNFASISSLKKANFILDNYFEKENKIVFKKQILIQENQYDPIYK